MHRRFDFQRAINTLTALIYAVEDVARIEAPEEALEEAEETIPRDLTLHIQGFKECLKTARGILAVLQQRKAEVTFKSRLELLRVEDVSPRLKGVLKEVLENDSH